jgi:hypothetical protein
METDGGDERWLRLTIIPLRLWTSLFLQFLRWDSQFRSSLSPESIYILLFRWKRDLGLIISLILLLISVWADMTYHFFTILFNFLSLP